MQRTEASSDTRWPTTNYPVTPHGHAAKSTKSVNEQLSCAKDQVVRHSARSIRHSLPAWHSRVAASARDSWAASFLTAIQTSKRTTRCDRDTSPEETDGHGRRPGRRAHRMTRASGNRGRTVTGASQPVSKRGPGSCGHIIGDTRGETRVIPFGRMSALAASLFPDAPCAVWRSRR